MHYVVTDPRCQLPRFLAMFHRLVALGAKIIREWDGSVWDRSQTSVVELCTRQALVEKIAYTFANPVEAGLVWEAYEWPGVKTTVDDIGKTKLHARRPNHYFRSKKQNWVEKEVLDVTLPPWIASADAEVFREDIRNELTRLENAAHERIPRHRVLGAKRAMKVHPESRVTSHEAARQLNPSIAVGRGAAKEVRAKAIAKLRTFRASYRAAMLEWRAGDRSVVFPAGTYAMRVVHGVNIAKEAT
jgi:putative transposase